LTVPDLETLTEVDKIVDERGSIQRGSAFKTGGNHATALIGSQMQASGFAGN
jgi:hypothetical protein